jgi:indolepyruvate ferredoxin oxidoreductase beta subunit
LDCAASKVHYLDATQRAKEIGSVKAVNILLLGALSSLLDVSPSIWEDVIAKYVPDKYRELNVRAFQEGRVLITTK